MIRFADDPPSASVPWTQLDLDAPAPPGEDGAPRTLGDVLGLATRPTQGTALDRELQRARIGRALGMIRPRDRCIVTLTYGLDGGPALVLADVGAVFAITKQRAEQLHARGLRDLRAALAEARR